jgi:hypothetical protein
MSELLRMALPWYYQLGSYYRLFAQRIIALIQI